MTYKRTSVLDHGYVQLIDTWGSDAAIVEAARMSTNKGFRGWGPQVKGMQCSNCGVELTDDQISKVSCYQENLLHVQKDPCSCGSAIVDAAYTKAGDEKLLKYLYENKHISPFEQAGMVVEVQAPVFVLRQWMRHRTQSYSEMSARYTPLPDVSYLPAVDRLMVNSTKNKQAGIHAGAKNLDRSAAEVFRRELEQHYEDAQIIYENALGNGVPKELARVHLPVARYSRMRASANLRNWLGFLTLRMDLHAQEEIRVFADVVGGIVANKYPRTWKLFLAGNKQ